MKVFDKIFNRIADVFSIFDFSFIISGTTAFVQIYIFLLFSNYDVLGLLSEHFNWYFVIFIIYILGLVMFALGRLVRQELLEQKKYKYKLFEEYNVCKAENKDKIDALYCKYWDNLKTDAKEKDYEYYNRLWVMTAVYEGLFGCVILGIILLIAYYISIINNVCCNCCAELGKGAFILFLICCVGYVLFVEAKKYVDTIVKDLIMKNNNYLDSSEM